MDGNSSIFSFVPIFSSYQTVENISTYNFRFIILFIPNSPIIGRPQPFVSEIGRWGKVEKFQLLLMVEQVLHFRPILADKMGKRDSGSFHPFSSLQPNNRNFFFSSASNPFTFPCSKPTHNLPLHLLPFQIFQKTRQRHVRYGCWAAGSRLHFASIWVCGCFDGQSLGSFDLWQY